MVLKQTVEQVTQLWMLVEQMLDLFLLIVQEAVELVFDDVLSDYGPIYTEGTGGTVTTSGDYKIHTFNSTSNFVVSQVSNQSHTVEYLVVAGGASGGTGCAGGGGGAGGYRTNYPSPDTGGTTITAQTYPVSVGVEVLE